MEASLPSTLLLGSKDGNQVSESGVPSYFFYWLLLEITMPQIMNT